MTEEWRPIGGFLGAYEVSSEGRVRSLPRRCASHSGTTRRADGKLLRTTPDSRGYPRVVLSSGALRFTRRVHELVLLAFVGPSPFPGAHARHLDDVPTNNAVSNLAWGTPSQNHEDAARNQRISLGAARAGTRLNEEAVKVIRVMLRRRTRCGSLLARLHGVHAATIMEIKHGRNWRYVEVPSWSN